MPVSVYHEQALGVSVRPSHKVVVGICVYFVSDLLFFLPLKLTKKTVTLISYVCFFSTVYFQMSPQIASLRGCIVALVAFVWLFSTVFL